MSNDWFFEKFALIADAPGAIPIMRELIIQFAVRGKLTGHIVGESTKEEIELLLGFKGCGEDSETPNSEVNPFSIPANWRWVRVGDSVNMINGKAFKPEDWSINGVPIIRIQNLNKEHATFNRCNTKIDSKYHVNNDDFLISWSGTPGTSFGAFIWNRGFAYLNQHIFRCELAPGVFDKKFLRVAINARLDEMISYAQGAVGLRHITKGKLESIRIPLPPLAEQKRIVAKVDELMGLCDALESQQQERELRKSVLVRSSLSRFAESPTPENLGYLFHKSYDIPPSELRKSILTLAVQGKLVPQDPNDRPAEESVLPQNKKATTSKNEQDVPFELPSAWQWTPLGKVSELINGDRSKSYPNKDEYVAQGVPWINTGHIEPAGTLSMELMHYITRKKFDSLRSGKVRPGDLVYCLRGATLGKTAIITQFDEGAVASSLVIIRLAVTVNPRFAYRFLTSPLGREQIFQFDNGSAQPNLSANNVKKYWMPLPPLAEQHRIVTKVDQLMALVDELERQQAASRENASKLLDAIVQEMTSGG
jgi:type I restriction enzyme S subunit